MRYLSPTSCELTKIAATLRMQFRRPPPRVRWASPEPKKEGVNKHKAKDDKGRVFGWHYVCIDDQLLSYSHQQWRCAEHSKRLDLHVHRKMHETSRNVLWFLCKLVGKVPKRQLAMLSDLILKLNRGHPKLMLQDLLKRRNRRVKQQLLPWVEKQDQREN